MAAADTWDPAAFGLGAPIGQAGSAPVPGMPLPVPGADGVPQIIVRPPGGIPQAASDSTWDPASFGLGAPVQEQPKPAAPSGMPSPPSAGPLQLFPAPAPGALGRIGAAAAEGFHGTPPILTPEAQASVEQSGPVGKYVLGPAAQVAGGALAAGGALLRGGQQFVQEAVDPVAPGLGRDLAAMPEAFAPGLPNTPMAPNRFAPAMERPTAPRNALAPDVPEMVVRPPREPVAQSVGAASRDTSAGPLQERTTGQVQTDFEKSVMQTARDRAGPGGEDHTVYVPGAQRTEAARVFTVDNAVNEKMLREVADPRGFGEAVKKIESDSNNVILDEYMKHAGDPRALELAREARDQATPNAIDLFTNQRPVDASPVVAAIDGILNSPSEKRSAVRSVLKDVRDSLFDRQGNLETMPDQLYGARQNITDKLKLKTGDAADQARLAKVHLQEILSTLDPIIGQGAPKFQEYLPRFAELSKPINQMGFLQSKLLGPGKITDANGNIQYGRMQKLLENIAADRKKPGINDAKTLTDAQLEALVNIRNELAATHYRDELARTKGSDTAQKASAFGRVARTGGELATHGLLYATLGPVGNVAYQFGVKPGLEALRQRRETAAVNKLKTNLLNTTPTRNQLAPP